MFRRIFPYCTILFMMLLDTSVMPILLTGWIFPLCALTSVLAFGLAIGYLQGALLGILAGILLDVSVSTPYALQLILYGLCGFAAGAVTSKLHRSTRTLGTLITPAACLFLYEIGMMLYSLLAGKDFNVLLLWQCAVRVLINTVLVQIEYMIYVRVCKPKTARYDLR